jgi:hypothetical protein
MKNIFTSDDNCNGVTSCAQETTKKVKATTAKMAKVDGAGMAFVSETIDYGTIAHNADGQNLFTTIPSLLQAGARKRTDTDNFVTVANT